MIKVIAPATSANLGCGFDTLGLAVSLYNRYSAQEIRHGCYVNGKPEDRKNSNNLILNSLLEACKALNYEPKGIKLHIKSKIPPARGLGSSSSCIVGGVALGFAIAGKPMDKDRIFDISAGIEGHPDNVAPCVYGGATLAYMKDGVNRYYPIPVHEKYRFCAFIPDFRLSTQKARKALPEAYEKADVVFNVSRAALLPLVLEKGDNAMLKEALEDRMHQPYRKGLIENYDEVFAIAEKCGFAGTYLSGAGPTIMGVYDDGADVERAGALLKELSAEWKMNCMELNQKGMEVLG